MTLTGQITGLAFGGDGILKEDGKVIFVPFTAPGDVISCRITQAKKNYARGELIAIEKPSPHRIAPRCPYFGTCGGCQLQHLDEKAQKEYKRQVVMDALTRIGGLKECVVSELVPSRQPWHYRRHVTLHLRWDEKGLYAGYYALDNKTVIPITECPIFIPKQDPLLKEIAAFLSTLELPPSHTGKLTLVKTETEKTLLVFHLKMMPASLPQKIESALQAQPSWAGFIVSTPQGIRKFGDTDATLQIDGLTFRLSPLAFLQNHPEESLRIYQEIQARVEEGPVLDLYCGIGITSLLLAKKGLPVIGVEHNKEAVRAARASAEDNQLPQATFIQADVDQVVEGLLKEKRPSWVLVNPPREGLSDYLIDVLQKERPKGISYLSCMPPTLARDLSKLCQSGYRIKQCQPFDMFPQTGHVETLVELRLS